MLLLWLKITVCWPFQVRVCLCVVSKLQLIASLFDGTRIKAPALQSIGAALLHEPDIAVAFAQSICQQNSRTIDSKGCGRGCGCRVFHM